jgi:hypothetical protein
MHLEQSGLSLQVEAPVGSDEYGDVAITCMPDGAEYTRRTAELKDWTDLSEPVAFPGIGDESAAYRVPDAKTTLIQWRRGDVVTEMYFDALTSLDDAKGLVVALDAILPRKGSALDPAATFATTGIKLLPVLVKRLEGGPDDGETRLIPAPGVVPRARLEPSSGTPGCEPRARLGARSAG